MDALNALHYLMENDRYDVTFCGYKLIGIERETIEFTTRGSLLPGYAEGLITSITVQGQNEYRVLNVGNVNQFFQQLPQYESEIRRVKSLKLKGEIAWQERAIKSKEVKIGKLRQKSQRLIDKIDANEAEKSDLVDSLSLLRSQLESLKESAYDKAFKALEAEIEEKHRALVDLRSNASKFEWHHGNGVPFDVPEGQKWEVKLGPHPIGVYIYNHYPNNTLCYRRDRLYRRVK